MLYLLIALPIVTRLHNLKAYQTGIIIR